MPLYNPISNSDLIEEGSENLYHTNDRVDARISSKIAVYNTNHLFNAHKQLSKMETANEKLKILILGDSISTGANASNPLTLTAQETLSYFGLLNEYFKDKCTTTNTLFKLIKADTTTGYWTLSGTWTDTEELTGNQHYRRGKRTLVGGAYATCDFTGTGVDILFLKDTYGATADIYIDDAVNTSVNLDLVSGNKQLYNVSITGLTDASHTLKIVSTLNDKYLSIFGCVETGHLKGSEITNLSQGGARTRDIEGNYATYITHKAYDIVIFSFLHNDNAYNTGIETYKANLRNFIVSATANKSDVILLATGATTLSKTSGILTYLEAMRSVAVEKDVCMIDTVSRWVSGIASGNIAQFIDDGTHPNAFGHRDIYKTIVQAFNE